MYKNQKSPSSICWDCKNCIGKCPWSENFEPVPGWDATPTKVKCLENRYTDSFIVHNCPLFEKDEYTKTRQVNIKELASLLDISVNSVWKNVRKGNLVELCKEKGFSLEIESLKRINKYYILDDSFQARYIAPEVAKLFRINIKNSAF